MVEYALNLYQKTEIVFQSMFCKTDSFFGKLIHSISSTYIALGYRQFGPASFNSSEPFACTAHELGVWGGSEEHPLLDRVLGGVT